MKIVMFTSDPQAFVSGSHTWNRMRLYEAALEKLELVRMDRSQGRYARFWRGYKKAKLLVRGERYDLIVAQDVEHAFLAWHLSRRCGVPFQMQIHTDIFSPYVWRGSMLNKARVLFAMFLIPRASCIRVVSERIRRSITARYPDTHISITVLPVIPAYSGTPEAKLPEFFTVLMVARLEKEKNIPLALRVFAKFLRGHPGARLRIVGNGSQRAALKRMCAALGIEHSVEFREAFSMKEYETAHVLLLTSNYEGYGMVALEALRSGLPVIMTNVGVAGEVVLDGVNGLVVPVGDEEKLLEALTRYAGDSAVQDRLRRGAKATQAPYASQEEYRDKLLASWRTCGMKN